MFLICIFAAVLSGVFRFAIVITYSVANMVHAVVVCFRDVHVSAVMERYYVQLLGYPLAFNVRPRGIHGQGAIETLVLGVRKFA